MSLTTSEHNEHNLLQVQEVADYFRVSYMSIYRLVASGGLRSVRVGRQLRISREDLERFVVENTTPVAA